jgi:hypothetical protein
MNVEAFYQHLAVPKACLLGKRIYKKQFHDNAKLTSADKKALSEDVDAIEWRYTLKPSTINIPRYVTEERDYSEVALLHIRLKEPKRQQLIGKLMQRSIPYPTVLIMECEGRVLIQVADKRINQADSEKMVIDSFLDTGWIHLHEPSEVQQKFLGDFCITDFSYANFHAFYQSLVQRIVALNCAEQTGYYTLLESSGGMGNDTGEEPAKRRIEHLKKLDELEKQQISLRSALKKESQFNQRLELNMKLKKLAQKMDSVKEQL